MPRKARRKSGTGIYHVILRGINKQTIFEDDEDKRKFLENLKKYKKVSGFKLYSYCLMDNHVHLLVKESEETVSEALKRISSSYVYWYNMKYERIGHLFQERFKSENVETRKYFLTVLRYIHQNPLKAGLAKDVWGSEWTSVHEYVGKAGLVDIDMGLRLFSPDRKTAIKMFIDFMEELNNDQCMDLYVRARMSDRQVREYLLTLGVTSNSVLQRMDREDRDDVLVRLKELNGVS
ncbi:transposase [Pseudalkalibacillus caeni]|uniref:transposase n=1 Tax=Exobacillus caeni TaxID=2574798 RepID=UPI001FE2601F|nr:transposase [Pseudalkalibacillus caeni]